MGAIAISELSNHELHQRVLQVQRERARLAVEAAELLHEWERRGTWREGGVRRASLALGAETRCDHTTAATELRRARFLQQSPELRAAVSAGRLSVDHVDLFMRHATPARVELYRRDEAELVRQCCGLVLFDDARKLLAYWAFAVDEELGRGSPASKASTMRSHRSQVDGLVRLRACLSPVDGEIVQRELRRLEREISLEDRTAGVVRGRAELQAAALVRMASRSLNAHGATARPLFQVVVGDHAARHLCELGSGTVVHPADLVPHLGTAVMEVFLFDGPGAVIAKSSRRTFTGALRRAVLVRDRRCRGGRGTCPEPAEYCDVDHRTPAARGGPTTQFNGRALCAGHNRIPELHEDASPLPESLVDARSVVLCRLRWLARQGPQ
jgi:Domain of unknown function (DUF222)